MMAHLINDAARQDLLVCVARKEYLGNLFEKGKISRDEYLDAVNALRAA